MPAPTGAQGDAGPQDNGTPPGTGDQKPAAGDSGAQDTQKAIDAIVARERKRADAEIERIRTDYDRRISDLESRLPKPPGQQSDPSKPASPDVNAAIEAARKPLQDELASERAARLKLEETTLTSIVQSAAKDTVSPETVAMMAKGQVRFTKDGGTEVIDANGNPRYTANGPMTVKDLVAEIATKNPFLIPASVRKGGNYNGASQQGQQTTADQIAALEAEGKFAEANALKSAQLWSMPKPAAAAPAGQ